MAKTLTEYSRKHSPDWRFREVKLEITTQEI